VHVVRGSHDNWLYEYIDDLVSVISDRLALANP
jgi:hypothetical protein